VLIWIAAAFVSTTAGRIIADPLGEGFAASDERRSRVELVHRDMRRRSALTATILAAEVGVAGYYIPGKVSDLLGLVSPDVPVQWAKTQVPELLDMYRPDYVLMTDENQYRPTGFVHQSRAFQERYDQIGVVARRVGDHYIAFARNAAAYSTAWNLYGGAFIAAHRLRTTVRSGEIDATSEDASSYLAYRLDERVGLQRGDLICLSIAGRRGIVRIALEPVSTAPFRIALNDGGRQEVCGRLNSDARAERLRIDTGHSPNPITLGRVFLLRKATRPLALGGH
jgi:hypothetical protein